MIALGSRETDISFADSITFDGGETRQSFWLYSVLDDDESGITFGLLVFGELAEDVAPGASGVYFFLFPAPTIELGSDYRATGSMYSEGAVQYYTIDVSSSGCLIVDNVGVYDEPLSDGQVVDPDSRIVQSFNYDRYTHQGFVWKGYVTPGRYYVRVKGLFSRYDVVTGPYAIRAFMDGETCS